MTAVVVRCCETLGWEAAARGHAGQTLPVSRSEYLALDGMAFDPADRQGAWPLPVAIFELENSPHDKFVSYALWKTLLVRTGLRVVMAYRRDLAKGSALTQLLERDVVRSWEPQRRMSIEGETVLLVGNRGDAETFPWAFFRSWTFDLNVAKFTPYHR